MITWFKTRSHHQVVQSNIEPTYPSFQMVDWDNRFIFFCEITRQYNIINQFNDTDPVTYDNGYAIDPFYLTGLQP